MFVKRVKSKKTIQEARERDGVCLWSLIAQDGCVGGIDVHHIDSKGSGGGDTLDNLIYKTVAVSFPLLTLMIIAGAYWANRTWGSYWSWDPKEDWALITWLTYAGYLHMRLTRGWRGRRAAYMAIIGFAIVMFTFFGVTYLLPGLHAYA